MNFPFEKNDTRTLTVVFDALKWVMILL